MKIVFLALLLLNLGFLAWNVWIAPAPRPAVSAALEADPSRSALPEPQPVAHQVVTAAGTGVEQPGVSAAEPAVCAAFGPFADRPAATAVAIAFRQPAAALDIASRATSVIDSYRVFFPPYPTAAAAQDMGARLRRAGVKDIYIIPGGEQRNAVSVGVFKDRDGAERRRRHLSDLGFTPAVEALERHDETRYWIRARNASAADLLRQAAAESGGEKRILSCAHVAATAVNP
ncbi:MAG TPA: hypothetical protein VFK45_07235 [Gammaproteobacteria bacterium]|nr:hypothetical protein [Gammaproteobacteria bacterium]